MGLKILITFAAEAEFAPWRRRAGFRAVGDAAYAAELDGAEVRAVITGMGPKSARRAARAALAARPDACISAGAAGGLRAGLRCGDVLAARAVREGEGEALLLSHAGLLEQALACGAQPAGTFWTRSALVLTREKKAELAGCADAVEMESYAVLSEARAAGVPAVAVRAVGDTADDDLPFDLQDSLDGRGRVRLGAVLQGLLRRPHRLPALLRLARQSRRAAARLAEFLDAYVRELAAAPGSFEAEREAELTAT